MPADKTHTDTQTLSHEGVQGVRFGNALTQGPTTIARSPFRSPYRMFVTLCLSIFISEAAVMFILSFFPEQPVVIEMFTDATLLIFILAPSLYMFLFRQFERHNAVLETLISEKTTELKEKNALLADHSQQLEIEVAKKTEALKKEVDDLEQYKKLTVGRELRMVEMKNELEELRSKLT